MENIVFIDTEVSPRSKKILDIGGIKNDDSIFHSSSIENFIDFLKNSEYVCGHNILNHDLKYIKEALPNADKIFVNVIDTLYLSPLLFPKKPYHAILKDDKLQIDELNSPVNDSKKAKELFYDEISSFHALDDDLQKIFYTLLKNTKEFSAFFEFINFKSDIFNLQKTIYKKFNSEICEHCNLEKIILENPIELAYSLALINCSDLYSITPPWVLKNYPNVENVMFLLRNNPCVNGCKYCKRALDIHQGLKRYFGFDSFRTYDDEPLQEKATQATIENKSILTIFPTGGGKSITFQLPALMNYEAMKGLNVVISPLQSLMKDQVDNLEKIGITRAVTINGLLDPIERAKSFERVENGTAAILYISPESLRSKTIEKLLLGRKILRFVIDEAHCFSSWGQDFRVDYLYIGDFIKSLQEKKNLKKPISVSCFTATAKRKVIKDIQNYFKEKLSLELELFCSHARRTNLQFKVYKKEDEQGKYNALINLIEEKNCPTIVYVSRTKKTKELAERLSMDGCDARAYHGKMDSKEKMTNQNAFLSGEIQIMVATSAFGMGVDKKDVGMVVHYEISDSLENYIQEAGRAGRDENILAECFVLFNEEDLDKHLILLNQTKLSKKEVDQIWKAIKNLTKFRSNISSSALEIARKAGWDDSVYEIETRVKTAISALEESGYLKRGQNIPRVFANSILVKNAQEAIERINNSSNFHSEKQKENAVRIIKKLISSKHKIRNNDEEAEARIDYISDRLGIVKEDVIQTIRHLREANILADAKDLTAYIKKGEKENRSLNIVKDYLLIENFLWSVIEEQEKDFHIKELNENAEKEGLYNLTPKKFKTIINFWSIKNWIEKAYNGKDHVKAICKISKNDLKIKIERRQALAEFIINFTGVFT